MGFRDAQERAERIALDARVLGVLLKAYDGRDRIFALTEMVRICQRDLASRESSEYHIDFTQDETPTNPDIPDVGDRTTRRVKTSDMKPLIDRSKRKL